MKTILNWLFYSPKEEGTIKDIMRHSKQWQRPLTKEEIEWYNHWLPIIRVQRKRVSRALDRMAGQKEMQQFWSKQV